MGTHEYRARHKRGENLVGDEIGDGRVAPWESDENSGMELMTRGGPYKDMRGRYRMRYCSDAKALGGAVKPFEGVIAEF
jgi:hypothetical protein